MKKQGWIPLVDPDLFSDANQRSIQLWAALHRRKLAGRPALARAGTEYGLIFDTQEELPQGVKAPPNDYEVVQSGFSAHSTHGVASQVVRLIAT